MLLMKKSLGGEYIDLNYCVGVVIRNNSDKDDELIRKLIENKDELVGNNLIIEHSEMTWDGVYKLFIGIKYFSTVIDSSDTFEVIDKPKYSAKLRVLDKLRDIGIYDYSEKDLVMVMI